MLKINNQTSEVIVLDDIIESVNADESKEIEKSQEHKWQSSEDLLTEITAGNIKIERDGTEYTDYSDQVHALLQYLVTPKDSDGAEMTRLKMFKSGVAVRFNFFEFTTSKIGSLKHTKIDGSDLGFCTLKFFNASDVEVTDAADEGTIVKTQLDFEPPSIDYEIIAGKFYQAAAPASNVRVWVIAVPDVPAAYGGSVYFVSGGANLKLMPAGIAFETDGRVPKKMTYDETNHTSKLRIVFIHPAGVQHEAMGELEIAY